MPARVVALVAVLFALVATAMAQPGSSVFSSPSGTISGSNAFLWSGRSQMQSPSDGIITLLNNAGTDFTRLQIGGTTNSFPALRHTGTRVDFVTADNASFVDVSMGNLNLGGNGKLAYGGGAAFASIGTILASNGDSFYCSDCKVTTGTPGNPSTITNNTCTSGGSGALAIRLNGVNVCVQ